MTCDIAISENQHATFGGPHQGPQHWNSQGVYGGFIYDSEHTQTPHLDGVLSYVLTPRKPLFLTAWNWVSWGCLGRGRDNTQYSAPLLLLLLLSELLP